jgi:CRISPR-associated protein Csy1
MFSSTLENAVHEPLRSVTDAFFKARGTQKNKPTFADHATYPGLVRKNIGGANPQNVSPLNSVRHGNNYLLTSLPPAAWKPHEGADPLKLDTVFQEKRGALFFSGEVRASIRELVDFLKTDPDRTQQTRERVRGLVRAVATEVALFGATMRGRHPAGWTRDGACRLPLCEQLWLDPERTELPLRNDPEHPHWGEDDAAFNAAYQRGDWADEVAGRFGRWLNQQLRERSDTLVALGDPETRYFASESILEVSWPIPQQRRARVGAA